MNIISWNVNGLRAAVRKGFLAWLATTDAEIVAMQETRVTPDKLPAEVVALDGAGWHARWSAAERAGYSGVGLLSRRAPESVETSLGVPDFDAEGRVQLARFGALLVANVYFPNGSGKNRDNGRVPFKLDFYRRLFDLLEPERASGRPLLVVGDYNTAHRPVDLARPKANERTSGFLPEERAELDRWLGSGWTDTFRHVHGDVAGAYSWWSQRFGVRDKNIGWRIDYVLASQGALPFVRDAFVRPEVTGSDHCPVGVELDPGAFDASV